jgi:hypothetical protein
MSPDRKAHNQIDHILIDRLRHLSVLDVRSFRAADCDSDHYLVVAKVRESLAVNKQRSQRFHMERFDLEKLNEAEGTVEYAIRKVQESQVELKLNGTHQLLSYADDVNLLGDNIDTIKEIRKFN